MQVFRSRAARVLAVAVVAVMTLSLLVAGLSQGAVGAAISLPPALLISFLALLLFWFPRVEVDDDGVRILNVFREVKVSWGAIKRIDTRWALEITTSEGRYTAWGATAPGRHSSIFASRDQGQHLPESTYIAGTVRPGDLITSDSGAAAAHIRRIWEAGRDKSLDAKVEVRWHFGKLAGLAALLLLNLISF